MFKVNWDNGASACGTFPDTFDTFEEADAFGKNWADESNLRDFCTTTPWEGFMAEEPGSKPSGNEGPFYDDGYSYDVIELKNGRWETVE